MDTKLESRFDLIRYELAAVRLEVQLLKETQADLIQQLNILREEVERNGRHEAEPVYDAAAAKASRDNAPPVSTPRKGRIGDDYT